MCPASPPQMDATLVGIKSAHLMSVRRRTVGGGHDLQLAADDRLLEDGEEQDRMLEDQVPELRVKGNDVLGVDVEGVVLPLVVVGQDLPHASHVASGALWEEVG